MFRCVVLCCVIPNLATLTLDFDYPCINNHTCVIQVTTSPCHRHSAITSYLFQLPNQFHGSSHLPVVGIPPNIDPHSSSPHSEARSFLHQPISALHPRHSPSIRLPAPALCYVSRSYIFYSILALSLAVPAMDPSSTIHLQTCY